MVARLNDPGAVPCAIAQELFDRLLSGPLPAGGSFRPAQIEGLPALADVLAAERSVQAAIAQLAVAHAMRPGTPLRHLFDQHDAARRWLAAEVAVRLLRRKLPLTAAELGGMVTALSGSDTVAYQWTLVGAVAGQCERHADQLTGDTRAALGRLRDAVARWRTATTQEERRMYARLDALSGAARQESRPDVSIDTEDAWGHAAQTALNGMAEPDRDAWLPVLAHAATATASRAPAKWLAEARRQVDACGEARFLRLAGDWLDLLDELRHTREEPPTPATPAAPRTRVEMITRFLQGVRTGPGQRGLHEYLTDTNATLVRGLVWAASTVDNTGLARTLAQTAEICVEPAGWQVARSQKVANACIWALSAMPGMTGVVQLQRLRRRLKQANMRDRVDQALDAAAARLGLPRADLDDLAVPDFGLSDGRLVQPIGGCTATINAGGPGRVRLIWADAAGKPLRAAPAAVRREHAGAVADLKETVQEIDRILTVQRDRIERLYLTDRAWPFPVWRERYLDHPLLGILARRLIWRVEQAGGASAVTWHEGALRDVAGAELTVGTDAAVRLWHPLGEPVETVMAWRAWLEEHQVRQPFKQAHREVYLLTDAERRTDTYSNRFAAHMLRQHQFLALCRQRGWRYGLQGGFDGGTGAAVLLLPEQGLQAEYWVEGIEAGENAYSDAGIALYISTDQVRFSRPNTLDEVHLAEAPPLLFSEVLRDVDLFVNIGSIGSDPTWGDNGAEAHRAYWNRFSFGELTEQAKVRRSVLERIVPRLAIAARCTLGERFLEVRGDLRRYKIHLGSGNILMEPGSEYLCIVPSRGEKGADGLFLPFEGDSILSIILSKALLLASDTNITDPTIVSQLRK